jgi:hypothetical protein
VLNRVALLTGRKYGLSESNGLNIPVVSEHIQHHCACAKLVAYVTPAAFNVDAINACSYVSKVSRAVKHVCCVVEYALQLRHQAKMRLE